MALSRLISQVIHKMQGLTVKSFNARGLGDKFKRRLIFDWLRQNERGLVCLQETHSTKETEGIWKSQWGGKIIFSHGISNSSGVAVLVPPGLDIDIINHVSDIEGRLLIMEANYEEHNFILCNVYAPTKDKKEEQLAFLEKLRKQLENYLDRDLIIGGDFNACINPEIDKSGGTKESQSLYAKEIESLQEEFNLCDVWRIRHPNLKRYSRRDRTRAGLVQSRLDFWLISTQLENKVTETDIHPGRRSDHSLISLKINFIVGEKRGRGFWKMNTSLLHDQDYLMKIRNVIQYCKQKYESLEDKRLLWDTMKCEIRAETISFSCHKAKTRKQEEVLLTERL